MSNTTVIIAHWSAVKNDVQRERQRLLSEYAKAREQVLAGCGQDISQSGKPLVINSKPVVAIRDGDILAAVGGGILTSLSSLQPSDHWPGHLALWEKVLSALSKVNAERIVSAWARATE